VWKRLGRSAKPGPMIRPTPSPVTDGVNLYVLFPEVASCLIPSKVRAAGILHWVRLIRPMEWQARRYCGGNVVVPPTRSEDLS